LAKMTGVINAPDTKKIPENTAMAKTPPYIERILYAP
jgi:hypothetical protein